MPYIEDEQIREDLWWGPERFPSNTGELNYLITRLCHQYIQEKGLKYKNINEVIGVLECAKLELYRMIAAPYEDKKKRENGAISELDKKTLEDVR